MSEHWVGRLGGGGEKQNTESERNRVLKLRWDLMGYAAEGVVLVFFWETALVGRAIGPLLLVAAFIIYVFAPVRGTFEDKDGEFNAFLPAIWWVLGFAILGALLTFMAAFNLWWPLWWWVSLEHGEMYIAPALDSVRHILPGWVFIVRAVAVLAPLVVWFVPTLVVFMRFVDEIAWGNRRNVTTRPVDIEQVELGPFGGVRPRSKARPVVKERDTDTVYSLNHRPHAKVHEGYVTLTATETENVERLCLLLNDKSNLSTATGAAAGWTAGTYRMFRDDVLRPRDLVRRVNSQLYKLTPAGAEFLTAHGLKLTPERYAELVQSPENNKEKNNGTT